MRTQPSKLERALLKLKWLFWSPERRYAYLWNRTCGR
jgi:hypothetical protein